MATDNDPLECWIEDTVVRKAKVKGWYTRKCIWGGMRSAPDRIFAKAGIVLWIELKRIRRTATESQAREHKKMRAAGCRVFVADSVDAAMAILDRHDTDIWGRAACEDGI